VTSADDYLEAVVIRDAFRIERATSTNAYEMCSAALLRFFHGQSSLYSSAIRTLITTELTRSVRGRLRVSASRTLDQEIS